MVGKGELVRPEIEKGIKALDHVHFRTWRDRAECIEQQAAGQGSIRCQKQGPGRLVPRGMVEILLMTTGGGPDTQFINRNLVGKFRP